MGDIALDLKTYLKSTTAVTDLVGAGTAARVYEDEAKQGVVLPYICFEIFEGASHEHLIGISGLNENRIQIDCYAGTSIEAYALAEAVRLAPLQMYRGAMGSSYVRVTSNGGYERGRDRPVAGAIQKRYWISRDYMFFVDEAVTA